MAFALSATTGAKERIVAHRAVHRAAHRATRAAIIASIQKKEASSRPTDFHHQSQGTDKTLFGKTSTQNQF